jgi:carboxyl-terminal processing protease
MESSRRGIVLLAAVLVISAVVGGLYGPSVRATSTGTPAGDMQQTVHDFSRVLAIVQQNYAEPVDADKAIYGGAIPGMLHSLDPHSNFFDPKQYALLREEEQGKYYGVGMTVASRENFTVVVAPFPGSPAYKAGIRPGDAILYIDGKACEGLTTDEVAHMLKGEKGTVVHITVAREGWDKPIEMTVTRDEIQRPGIDFYTVIRPGIGYIRVSSFLDEEIDRELADAVKQLDLSHLDGIVLDLRGNTGGLLNEAVSVSSVFLDKNELVVSHHGRFSPERRYYAVRGSGGNRVPLVVLVNGQTASASEIVAGAIQDHDRGLVVGEITFGKGLVQSSFPLSEDTALWLTTAKYYTPSGRLIQRDYKNVSLYDYLYSPHQPKNPEVKLTDGGRQVFGGGGITPDVVVASEKLGTFQELLLRRGVLYPTQQGVGDFTRYYLGSKPEITKDFKVTDAVMQSFRKFLDKQNIRYTEPQIANDEAWIDGKIKREVLTSVFGLDEGFRVALQDDPEVQKAIDLIPQAKALYENARKVLADRQSTLALRP